MKIKRLLAGIIACAMAVSAMAFTVSAEDNSYGDFNEDGEFEFSDFSIFSNPNMEIKVTYDNPEEQAGWNNVGFGFSIDDDWKDTVYPTAGGENEFAIAAIKVMSDIEADDVSTITYGKVQAMNGASLVKVEVYETEEPTEEPEGDGDDDGDGEEPGEDEDEVGARDPIVIDNIDHNFADGNYALSFSDYMELEDVFLIKKVTVQLTNNEYVNGTVGFTGGIDWITEDYAFADAGTHEVVADYPQDNIDEEMLDEEDWNPGLEVQQWWPKAEDNSDVLKIDSITIEFFAPGEDPAEEDPAEEDPAEEDPAEEDPAEETETPEAKNPTTGAGGIVAAVGMSALALTAVTVSRKRK